MTSLESVTEELESVEVRDKVDDDEKADPATLRTQFSVFAKFGDTAADGKTIKLSQSDKWFRQAGLITREAAANTFTTTDTGIAFKKVSK